MGLGTTINGSGTGTPLADRPQPGVVVLFTEAPLGGDGVFAASRELLVGRSPECAVCLDDPSLSRKHAALSFLPDGVVLRDLGSQNGTHVNGGRIEESRKLRWNDLIHCGATLLGLSRDIRGFAGWRTWGMHGPLVGGPVMRQLRAEIATFARDELEVLIVGESGTGKELVAREIHAQSGCAGPLVAVNCAAIPEPLFEAELFGATKGAYTDAAEDRVGLFRSASGGTLFLDEVGEISLGLQAKLLRAVELKEVRPIGSTRSVRVDARVVAATNRDLEAAVRGGRFREDLYHRLRGFLIHIPPLRERVEDIVLLADRQELKGSADFVERLLLHAWPGNVRELDRVMREAVARARAAGAERLQPQHLRKDLLDTPLAATPGPDDAFSRVREALTRAQGNVSRAAAMLGMHRAQVYAMLRDRGLSAADFRE